MVIREGMVVVDYVVLVVEVEGELFCLGCGMVVLFVNGVCIDCGL